MALVKGDYNPGQQQNHQGQDFPIHENCHKMRHQEQSDQHVTFRSSHSVCFCSHHYHRQHFHCYFHPDQNFQIHHL